MDYLRSHLLWMHLWPVEHFFSSLFGAFAVAHTEMTSPAQCDWLRIRIITYFVGISNNDKGKNYQNSHPGPYNLRLIGYQNDRRYIGKLQVSEIWAKTAFIDKYLTWAMKF